MIAPADGLEHESREEISSSGNSLLQSGELQVHTAVLVWRRCCSLATLIWALAGFLSVSEGGGLCEIGGGVEVEELRKEAV